ncbi:MAG: hypothetical protein AAF519_17665 [Bacteroidota bacterium]
MNKSSAQLFIEGLVGSMLSLVKVLILSKFRVYFPLSQSEECVILANGPSLNDFLTDSIEFLDNKDIICVNFFSRTDNYVRIQPTHYILTAPEYFLEDEKEGWSEIRNKAFSAMIEKTTWHMNLFVPMLAQNQQGWKKNVIQNPNINICYFNNTPIEGLTRMSHFFFKKNLGMPRPHNVLVPSLMIGIALRYKKIFMAGTDHNWTKELVVTEKNEVLLNQKHFYDKQLKVGTEKEKLGGPRPMYLGTTNQPRKLHEILEKFVHSFRSYWEIKAFAKTQDVKIYNLTFGSFIDAFERLKPPKIKL